MLFSLALNSGLNSSCLNLPSGGILGVYYHTQQSFLFCLFSLHSWIFIYLSFNTMPPYIRFGVQLSCFRSIEPSVKWDPFLYPAPLSLLQFRLVLCIFCPGLELPLIQGTLIFFFWYLKISSLLRAHFCLILIVSSLVQ